MMSLSHRAYRVLSKEGTHHWATPIGDSISHLLDDLTNIQFRELHVDNDGNWQIDPNPAKWIPQKLVAPVSSCPAIWCIGLNYRLHAKETNMEIPQNPTVFMKGVNVLNGPYDTIVKPKVCKDELDYEGELAIIIGKKCKDVSVENAYDYILGLSVVNDVSARRWQGLKGGSQWVRSKSFDSFLPIGPCIVPCNQLKDQGRSLKLQTTLTRGCETRVVQDSSTSDMIFSIPEIVSFLSQDTTLYPGTIIATGTPEGVGFTRKPPLYLQPEDVVSISIEGIGMIRNRVTL